MTKKTQDVLSPETFAVLACAQAVVDPRQCERFRGAVAACASADRLCETAVQHGMVGHLHKTINGDGEAAYAAAVRDPLANLYRLSAERALRQTAQLLRLLDDLRQRGIEAMPVKGPAWAERLYGDVTLRNWVDLDVVVPYEQVPAARAMLLDAGLRDYDTFDPRLLQRKTRTEGEVCFASTENDLLVDVHWQIGVGYGADALSAERLLSRAEPAKLLGRDILVPTATDMLLISCLHGTRHRWATVESLLALAVQVCDLSPEAWQMVMDAAREAGSVRRVTIAAAHVCGVFGVQRPPEVAAALAHDGIAQVLLPSLGPESLDPSPVVVGRRQLTWMLWSAATEDSIVESFAHAAARAFRPGPEDWQAVALPTGAEWLYYPLRPVRLSVKWASGLAPSRSVWGRGRT